MHKAAYEILLVEDESIILEDLKQKIEHASDFFRVVDTAKNGLEALEILKRHRPHVLITDLVMPRMDGIQLIREARSIYPDLPIVVISGYDTFSYAQTAMKYGVLEYLVKPVDDTALLNMLNSLEERLNAVMMQRQENNLIRTMKGYKLTEQQRRTLKYQYYYLFLINIGNLQSKAINFLRQQEYFAMLDENNLREICGSCHAAFGNEGIFIMDGFISNQRYVLYAKKEGVTPRETVVDLYKALQLSFPDYPITICYSKRDYFIEDLPTAAYELKKSCSKYMNIGHGRIIDLETAPVSRAPIPMQLIIARFTKLLSNGDARRFSNEFLEYFLPLHPYTQLQLEDAFIGILIGIHQQAPEKIGSDYEFMREEILEICAYELNYQRAVSRIIEVFLRLFDEASAETTLSSDTIYAMVHYIDEHYCDDLRIEDIAALYHYNSSYFSRVFRKTIGMAPSQYITNRRMEEARRLLIAHPEYSIGEISAACGYQDTHYFSRLFKQITTLSPSAFREQNLGEGN